ncbi:MAG: GPI inositol-deacylase [Chloroflexota bacterium]|nr:GPI inositol-deacylase [Chloroflexota bacterium]
MRRRLSVRGAASVSIAPLHMADWLAAGLIGFGPMLTRLGGAIRRTQAAAGGEPLLVVAHSGGGIATRLAMSEVSFRGHKSAVAGSIGALVTLGTPHGLAGSSVRSAHSGVVAARFLDRHSPATCFAPTTAYLTVGSDLVRPGRLVEGGGVRRRVSPLTWWDRLLRHGFEGIVGPLPSEGGDGIVSAAAAHLPGAEHLTFHDVRHGHIGGPWYGDEEIIERWWPRAVALWRGALAAREAAAQPRAGQISRWTDRS